MSLSIQQKVRENIKEIESGTVFSYVDLPVFQKTPNFTAVSKALSRLVQQGEIKRFSTGKYYRPKGGLLGPQPLSDAEKLKAYLYKNGKRNGYITGIALFNRLGLTTQLPTTYIIAANQVLNNKNLNTFKLKVIKSKAPVTEDNIKYLEILDIFDKIKKIPDSSYRSIFRVMGKQLQLLSLNDVNELATLAIDYYPPAVRALLGYCLSIQPLDCVSRANSSITKLKSSLNPLTTYRYSDQFWSNDLVLQSREWNIR